MNAATLQFKSSEFENNFFGSERLSRQKVLRIGAAVNIGQALILGAFSINDGINDPKGYAIVIAFFCLALVSQISSYFKKSASIIFNGLIAFKSITVCTVIGVVFLLSQDNFELASFNQPLLGFLLSFEMYFNFQGTNFLLKTLTCLFNLATYVKPFIHFYGNGKEVEEQEAKTYYQNLNYTQRVISQISFVFFSKSSSVGLVSAWSAGCLLFLLKSYLEEKKKRELFSEKQSSAELSQFIERILPTSMVITKYKSKEERSYYYSSNKRAQNSHGILNDDSFKEFAKRVTITGNSLQKEDIGENRDINQSMESMTSIPKKIQIQQSLFQISESFAKRQFQKYQLKKNEIAKSISQSKQSAQQLSQQGGMHNSINSNKINLLQQKRKEENRRTSVRFDKISQFREVSKGKIPQIDPRLLNTNQKCRRSLIQIPQQGIIKDSSSISNILPPKQKKNVSIAQDNNLQSQKSSQIIPQFPSTQLQASSNVNLLQQDNQGTEKQIQSTSTQQRPFRRTTKKASTVKLDLQQINENKSLSNQIENLSDTKIELKSFEIKENPTNKYTSKPSNLKPRNESVISMNLLSQIQSRKNKAISVVEDLDQIERVRAIYCDSEGRKKALKISIHVFQASEQFQIILIEDETSEEQIKTQAESTKKITKIIEEVLFSTRIPLTKSLYSLQKISETYQKCEEEIVLLQNNSRILTNRISSKNNEKLDHQSTLSNVQREESQITFQQQQEPGSNKNLLPVQNLNFGNFLAISLPNNNYTSNSNTQNQEFGIINSNIEMQSNLSAIPSQNNIGSGVFESPNERYTKNSNQNEKNLNKSNHLNIDKINLTNDLSNQQNVLTNEQNVLTNELQTNQPLSEQIQSHLKSGRYFGFTALNVIYNHIDYMNIIQKKQLELRVSEVSLKKVLNQILSIIQFQSDKKKVRIILINTSSIDSLKTDERRIKQILLNILNTLLDKMNNGYIAIKITDILLHSIPSLKITMFSTQYHGTQFQDSMTARSINKIQNHKYQLNQFVVKAVTTQIIGKLGPYAQINTQNNSNQASNNSSQTLSFLLYSNTNILKHHSISNNNNNNNQINTFSTPASNNNQTNQINYLNSPYKDFCLHPTIKEEDVQTDDSHFSLNYTVNKMIIDDLNQHPQIKTAFFPSKQVEVEEELERISEFVEKTNGNQKNYEVNSASASCNLNMSSNLNINNSNSQFNIQFNNSNNLSPNNQNIKNQVQSTRRLRSVSAQSFDKSIQGQQKQQQQANRFEIRNKQKSIVNKFSDILVEESELADLPQNLQTFFQKQQSLLQTRTNSRSFGKNETKDHANASKYKEIKKPRCGGNNSYNNNEPETEENLSSRRGNDTGHTSSKEVVSFFSTIQLKHQ